MLKQKILEALKYKREPMEKRISASQLGSSVYEILMRIKYGAIESKEINNATIGSILHKGLECIFKNEPMIDVELDLSYKYKEWNITGTADLYDKETKTIYDYKFIKKTKVNGSKTITGLIDKLKNNDDDEYFWQLCLLRYLANKNGLEVKRLVLFTVSPDAGWDYEKKRYIKFDDEVEIPLNYISDEKIEKRIDSLIKELNLYVDFENNKITLPDNCEAKTKYGFLVDNNGKKIPRKCELYCSYKDVCKLYRNKNLNLEWRF